MRLRFVPEYRTFSLCKGGNSAEDYEDASAAAVDAARFAVADGASEASFAALWARLLVERFVADAGRPWRGLGWLGPVRHRWSEEVDHLPLPWYAEEKRELGAFATFLGLAFRPGRAGEGDFWRALAVGDCCLFHTRGGQLVQSFPLAKSEDFGNRPRLLRSRTVGKDALDRQRETANGRADPGDCFFLMSDALAQWFLLRIEQGEDPLAEIASLRRETSPTEAFSGWVAERRRHELLRNDDVTLMIVDLTSPASDRSLP